MDRDVVLVVVSGSCTYSSDEGVQVAEPGDVLAIPAGHMHALSNASSELPTVLEHLEG